MIPLPALYSPITPISRLKCACLRVAVRAQQSQVIKKIVVWIPVNVVNYQYQFLVKPLVNATDSALIGPCFDYYSSQNSRANYFPIQNPFFRSFYPVFGTTHTGTK